MSDLFGNEPNKRKEYPIYSGVLKYFPDAIKEVSNQSYIGSQQHNPGKPMHWDRNKSHDELDALMRHLLEEDWVAVAWRALANLQKQIEKGKNNE